MKKLKVLAILLPLLSLLTVLIFIAACSNSSSGGSDEVAVAASEPGCSSDSDCPEGYLCNSYGECVPDPDSASACSINSDCPSGYICSAGNCVPDPNLVPACTNGAKKCVGNTVMICDAGTWRIGGVCEYGCAEGGCLTARAPLGADCASDDDCISGYCAEHRCVDYSL